VVGLLVMGVVVDRFGRRRFLTAGGLLMAAASLAFVTTSEFGPLLYALRVLQGLAFAMAFVAGAALAVDQAPSERLGQALGLFGVSMLAMNALAPVAVETLAMRLGWGPAFATAAAGALLCALLSRLLYEHPHEPAADAGPRSLLRVARRPEQLRAGAVIALVGSCFGSLFVFGQLYAIEIGLHEVHALFTAYAIAALTVRLGFGQLGDRLGRIRVSAAALIVYAAGAFAMPELATLGLAPIGAVFGLAHGLFYPTYNATVVDGAPPGERGKIVALFQGWFNVGMGAGSFALGLLAERSGYEAVFWVSGAGILLALGILLGGRRPRAGSIRPT
jgi:MFS family permease